MESNIEPITLESATPEQLAEALSGKVDVIVLGYSIGNNGNQLCTGTHAQKLGMVRGLTINIERRFVKMMEELEAKDAAEAPSRD